MVLVRYAGKNQLNGHVRDKDHSSHRTASQEGLTGSVDEACIAHAEKNTCDRRDRCEGTALPLVSVEKQVVRTCTYERNALRRAVTGLQG